PCCSRWPWRSGPGLRAAPGCCGRSRWTCCGVGRFCRGLRSGIMGISTMMALRSRAAALLATVLLAACATDAPPFTPAADGGRVADGGVDAGVPSEGDGGGPDAGAPDAGEPADAGAPDAGPADAGTPDAGIPADAGPPDAGQPPPAPRLTSTSPTSPSSQPYPAILGTAEPGSTIEVHAVAGCAGPVVGRGTAD